MNVMILEFSTFKMRFSSGAELPTDFVDSVPVSDVEAKGGEMTSFMKSTFELQVQS